MNIQHMPVLFCGRKTVKELAETAPKESLRNTLFLVQGLAEMDTYREVARKLPKDHAFRTQVAGELATEAGQFYLQAKERKTPFTFRAILEGTLSRAQTLGLRQFAKVASTQQSPGDAAKMLADFSAEQRELLAETGVRQFQKAWKKLGRSGMTPDFLADKGVIPQDFATQMNAYLADPEKAQMDVEKAISEK